MTKSPLAKAIDDWREANPGTRITLAVVRELNEGKSLRGADLRGAYLRGAYLGGAYLGGADLTGAYLTGAYLRGADLGGADLRGADLTGAYLRGAYLGGADLTRAYLTGAYLGAITFSAGPSGDGWMLRLDADGKPSATGEWNLNIGCFRNKTLADLRDLIEDKAEWPEARGEEKEHRRPYLVAVLALCEAHIAYQAWRDSKVAG